MKRNDIIEVKIEKMIFPNKGVGFYDGKKVILKNVLLGQTVSARVKKKRTDKIEAKLIEVVKRADYEIKSFCPHFGQCGGCQRQTVPYEKQTYLKGEMVKGLLEDEGIKGYKFDGVLHSPNLYNYRNKMEYSFGDEFKDGPLTLGMHKKGRHHDVVNVNHCKIAHEDSNIILENSLKFFTDNGFVKYNKRSQNEGFLRHLTVRRSVKTKEILIGLSATTFTNMSKEKLKPFVDCLLNLKLQGNIVGILWIKNDGLGDLVNGDIEVLYGRDYYIEELFDLKFKVSFYSFFQTNPIGAELLYGAAFNYMDNIDDKTVFDLFSGTGTIAQIMSKKAKKVVGIEIIEDAVKAAKENANLNNINNCEFLAGDVFEKLSDVKHKPDVIVVDPPRVGISEKALKKIINYKVNEITYISCNPVSLVKNLKTMQDSGYEVKNVVCVDMFAHTPHVETVVKLERK
ncbi:23S rRNA (uracil(1939)-C(5))-methyltransferase RlmD [Helicovermis profundi]|uniref:23S rRNA (Uracil(1939)-C(5))-methyltransferase RlmD n=1 Tax=Helicovermis profundi TaxID=3065157 RepID=A0AAU9E2K0_9FIRM|nr:23S rRNA (uracil(1939)-C(5))-methyltransferase RlmD [Clostridia bacterium S502]